MTIASTVTGAGNSTTSLPVLTVTGYPKYGIGLQSDETGTWYSFWTGGEVDEFFKIDRLDASLHVLMTVREGFILRMSSAQLERDWMDSADAVGGRIFARTDDENFLRKWFVPMTPAGRSAFEMLIWATAFRSRGGRPQDLGGPEDIDNNARLAMLPSDAAGLEPPAQRELMKRREQEIRTERRNSRAEGFRLMRELVEGADRILMNDPLNILYLETTLQAARSAYHRGYHYWRCYVEVNAVPA